MRKFNFNGEAIGKCIGGIGTLVVAGLVAVMALQPSVSITKTVTGNIDYGDVVGAITRSSMLSSHKQELITYIKPNSDVQVYKAILEIIDSSMFSSQKVEAIKHVCG